MDKRHNTVKARILRKGMTEAETVLWRMLRAREFGGFKFRRQHAIGPYVADFACLAEKLVIEADGGHHLQQAEDDAERTRFLELQGYRVVRFWNHEILTMQEAVREGIELALRRSHPHPGPLPPAGEGE